MVAVSLKKKKKNEKQNKKQNKKKNKKKDGENSQKNTRDRYSLCVLMTEVVPNARTHSGYDKI